MDSPTALLVIDMLNPYDHEDADTLVENVEPVVPALSRLVAEAVDDDVDLVYVNDNYGDFTATRDDIVRRALEGRRPDLIEPIVPPRGASSTRRSTRTSGTCTSGSSTTRWRTSTSSFPTRRSA